MPQSDESNLDGLDEDFDSDDEPIPAKRDIGIFQRKKERKDKDEDFEEDVFV
jgi:hypothetical protein